MSKEQSAYRSSGLFLKMGVMDPELFDGIIQHADALNSLSQSTTNGLTLYIKNTFYSTSLWKHWGGAEIAPHEEFRLFV